MRLIDADPFGVISFQGKSENFMEGVAFILEKIDNAPTVEERPHGEWVKDINMDKATVCSECGEEAWYKEYCGWVTKSNFCPNCGADMREGETNSASYRQVTGKLNSEIEKSKSEIVPDYRDGWRLKEGESK